MGVGGTAKVGGLGDGLNGGGDRAVLTDWVQIGFLTEWQMYAQKLEGDEWRGEVLDKSKIDKMSGMSLSP